MKLGLPLKHIYVTQPFGMNYVGFYEKLGLLGHNGTDFRCNIGCEVYAMHDGKVTVAREGNGFGKYIEIREDKYKTRYGHLSKLRVGQGTDVKKGQLIGLSGNSGKYTTGPHLHVDIKEHVDGRTINYNNGYKGAIDPALFFKKDWDKSRAYHRYGRPRQYWAEVKVRFKNPWLHRQLKKRNKMHLVYDNEFINALVYGGWDFNTMVNPAMWSNWAYLKKDEFTRGIKPFS